MREHRDSLTQKEQKIFNKIQNEIRFCLYDQSYDGSEVIWIQGVRTDMYDLFWEYEVEEKSFQKMLPHFECPECGFSEFELGFSVGVASKYDHDLEKLYNSAKKKYHQSFIDFEKHIIDTPWMALKNPLARRIHREIKNGGLRTTDLSGKFYRGRRAIKKPMTTSDLLVPDIGISNEGRFNHPGRPYFYLSESPLTAEIEVVQDETAPIELYIQEFEIVTPFSKILDLSHEFYEISLSTPPLMVVLFNFIEKRKNNKEKFKPDYYIPRFIADCAMSEGYEGIRYTSSLHHNGYNVVLFANHENVLPIGDPRLVVTKDVKDE